MRRAEGAPYNKILAFLRDFCVSSAMLSFSGDFYPTVIRTLLHIVVQTLFIRLVENELRQDK